LDGNVGRSDDTSSRVDDVVDRSHDDFNRSGGVLRHSDDDFEATRDDTIHARGLMRSTCIFVGRACSVVGRACSVAVVHASFSVVGASTPVMHAAWSRVHAALRETHGTRASVSRSGSMPSFDLCDGARRVRSLSCSTLDRSPDDRDRRCVGGNMTFAMDGGADDLNDGARDYHICSRRLCDGRCAFGSATGGARTAVCNSAGDVCDACKMYDDVTAHAFGLTPAMPPSTALMHLAGLRE
jgi:hypothetical protein